MHSEQSSASRISLRIPQQTLRELTGVSKHTNKFESWLNKLPKGHVGQTAKQMYLTLDEISRLKTTAQNRFELLELIRPTVLLLLPSLSKHYLNQPLILPEKASQVAALTQSLLLRLSTGYKVVIAENLKEMDKGSAKKNVKIALHHATTLSTLRLLHNYQLYSLTPRAIWHDIYLFYYIAEHYKLIDEQVREQKGSEAKSSIKHEFLRAVMLAASSPNQLSQTQIKDLFDATSSWAHFVKIDEQSNPSGLYYLDLLSDTPPTYHNWLATDKDSQLRNIYLGILVEKLEHYSKSPQSSELNIPATITPDLLTHLCDHWGKSSQRSFARIPQQGTVGVTVGFSASHYFISDQMEFSTFIRGGHPNTLAPNDSNLFLNPNHDPLAPVPTDQGKYAEDIWSLKYTAPFKPSDKEDHSDNIDTEELEEKVSQVAKEQPQPFQSFRCGVIDTSPGGYCIEWQGEISGQLRNGEVIGLKEKEHSHRQVGVVRWINQISADTARIGIELLSPLGQAGGAKVVHKKGPSGDFIRVIQLPEIPSIGQAATLLTPSTCFQEGDKILLTYLEDKVKAKLTKRISSTSGYCQFLFELLEQDYIPKDPTKPLERITEKNRNSANDDFSDVWKLI